MRDDPHRPVHVFIDGDTVRMVPLTDEEITEQARRDRDHDEQEKAALAARADDLATITASEDPVIQALVRYLRLNA